MERELLRRLIRKAFEWEGDGGAEAEPDTLRLPEMIDLIRGRGTQLEGVAADTIRKVRRENVRDELLEMEEIRVHDPNTPEERFTLLR